MICPICGGKLMEIRTKLVCSKCHQIIETCCDGGEFCKKYPKKQQNPLAKDRNGIYDGGTQEGTT